MSFPRRIIAPRSAAAAFLPPPYSSGGGGNGVIENASETDPYAATRPSDDDNTSRKIASVTRRTRYAVHGVDVTRSFRADSKSLTSRGLVSSTSDGTLDVDPAPDRLRVPLFLFLFLFFFFFFRTLVVAVPEQSVSVLRVPALSAHGVMSRQLDSRGRRRFQCVFCLFFFRRGLNLSIQNQTYRRRTATVTAGP